MSEGEKKIVMNEVMYRQATRVMAKTGCWYRIGFVGINTGGLLSTAIGSVFKQKNLNFLRRETGSLSVVGEASPREIGRVRSA